MVKLYQHRSPHGSKWQKLHPTNFFQIKYSAWTCSQELTRTCPILCHHCSRTTCRLWLRRYQKHSPPSPVALDQDPQEAVNASATGSLRIHGRILILFHVPLSFISTPSGWRTCKSLRSRPAVRTPLHCSSSSSAAGR